jgi:hypothetical protein
MGQSERVAAVSSAFDRSWSTIAAARGWWPAVPQVACARLLREADDRAQIVTAPDFVAHLGLSLRKWKAFRGVPFEERRLLDALGAVGPLLAGWQGKSLLTVAPTVGERLFELFVAVRDVKASARRWVATSKLLHHLLPDLVVPMDNEVIAPFLGRSALPVGFESAFLAEAYSAFVQLAADPIRGIGADRVRRAAEQVPYPIDGAEERDCRVGIARVVDFAIAGFVLQHGRRSLRDR